VTLNEILGMHLMRNMEDTEAEKFGWKEDIHKNCITKYTNKKTLLYPKL